MASRLKENLELIRSYKEDIRDAIESKGVRDVGSVLSTYADKIRAIRQQDDEDFVPEPGPQWTEEWEERGKLGTIVEYVVGDEYSTLLKIVVLVQGKAANLGVLIDWGDGTTSQHWSTSYSTYRHTYPAPGRYTVRVSDNAVRVGFTTGSSSQSQMTSIESEYSSNGRTALRKVVQWGSSLTSLAYCLYGATLHGYEFLPGEYDVPPLPPGLTSIQFFMESNVYYRGRIPYVRHLTKITGTSQYAFSGNTRATGCVQYPPPNTSSLAAFYNGCVALSGGIPKDFFHTPNVTSVASCFASCSSLLSASYPDLSQLTKCTSFASCFASCYGVGYGGRGYPAFPVTGTDEAGHWVNDKVTSISSMYDYNYSSMQPEFPDLSGLTKCTSVSATFRGNYLSYGRCPVFPPNVVSVSYFVENCRKMTGTFPEFPPTVSGDCREVFYSCYELGGSLPAFPPLATNIYAMFYYCRNATGLIPTMAKLANLGNIQALTSIFCGCSRVTGFEDGWDFPPASALNGKSTVNSFAYMFAYCYGIRDFPQRDMSAFTGITNVSYMFAEAGLTDLTGFTFPPNVTSMSYTFSTCRNARGGVSPWPAKVTNVSYCYQYCHGITDVWSDTASEIVRSHITTWTSCFAYVGQQLQQKLYNMCVSLGKTGTLTGAANYPPIWSVEGARKTGNDYWNIAYRPYDRVQNHRFTLEFAFNAYNASSGTICSLFGLRSTTKACVYLVRSGDDWFFKTEYGNATVTTDCKCEPGRTYTVVLDENGLTVDGTLYPWPSPVPDFVLSSTMYLLDINGYSYKNSDITFYRFDIDSRDPFDDGTGALRPERRYRPVEYEGTSWQNTTYPVRATDMLGVIGTTYNGAANTTRVGDKIQRLNGT